MDKRRKVELRHSLWIVWTFTLLFNWVAFFFIGGSAKRIRWILFGCIYLAVFVACVGLIYIYDDGSAGAYAVEFAVSSFWFASIFHAFVLRRPYLIRIGIIEDDGPDRPRRNQRRAGRPLKGKRTTRMDNTVRTATPTIDLNTCTEEEFASLPGIGVVRAKKAVSIRSQKGGFDSMDDFLVSLNVEPHFAVRIERLATVSKNGVRTTAPQSRTRNVDL